MTARNSGSFFQTDYVEWLRRGEASAKVIATHEAPDVGLSLARIMLAECSDNPPFLDLVILMCSEGVGIESVKVDHGFGRFTTLARPGNFVVNAPGVPAEASGPGMSEMLAVTLPWKTIRSCIEGSPWRETEHLPSAIHARGWHDHYTLQLFLRLWKLTEFQRPNDRVLLDEMIIRVAERLLWLGGIGLPRTKYRAVLPQESLGRVIDLLVASFNRPISLTEMAKEAGCSVYHFSRLFKASTGHSPIDYLLQYRVERAKLAIRRDAEEPLASIAISCGFSDQSHMGRHFKRILGTTPKKWREST